MNISKRLYTYIALVSLAALCTSACSGRGASLSGEVGGDTIAMRHSALLSIVEYEGHTDVEVSNPWDTAAIPRRYCLASEDGRTFHDGRDIATIRVPLRRAAVFSGIHCALMGELGAEKSVAGVCDPQYIHSPFVAEGIADGSIVNLGNSTSPNVESIIALQPDALMPSPYGDGRGYGRMASLGIPIIECSDYMESSPLGRAEWIRFYGRLLGKGALADSIFSDIEEDYRMARQTARTADDKPSMICELPIGGTWYMPCAESTMGIMYKDAGARYLFDDKHGAGSIPLSIEQALERGMNADAWLIKHHGRLTRSDILGECPLAQAIKARIWVCNTETSGYYEDIPFHPERLLENLVYIFHPELARKPKKTYFCPLE